MTFKRTEFSSLKLVGLLIAAVCLSGCETLTFSVSQPQPIPDISKLKKHQPGSRYALRLKLPDVEVDVMAANRVSPESDAHYSYLLAESGDKLLVFVALSPKTDGVRFDPSRMRYQPDDGELPDHPWLVQGPARKHSVREGRFKTCFPPVFRSHRAIYPPVTGSVPVTERACFRIFFNDDRTAPRPFTLFIEGISKSGKPVEVPAVEFWRKTWTEIQLDLS